MFGGGSLVPTVHAGKVRGLASTGKVRNPATPELPTINEIYPGYEVLIWHGLFVPAGTPQPIIDRLRAEIAVILAQPEFKKRLADAGSGEPYIIHARGVRRPHQERLREIRQADPLDRREGGVGLMSARVIGQFIGEAGACGRLSAGRAGCSLRPRKTYPNRPIRLIVGFPPGGAVDIIARIYAQGLSARLGQPVVVENKPGTGGNLASDTVAKAAPDGYTLLHGTENVFISNPHVYGARMPFDPFKDLVPVTSLVSNQIVLTVNPSSPANTLREFVELARASKPPLFYASIGNGSNHHLAMEMLKQHVGIDLIHVPYRGGGPAAIALLQRRSVGDVRRRLGGADDQIRQAARARFDRHRAQSGDAGAADHRRVYPGYEALSWHGLFVPAGTPQPIIDRLRNELKEVVAQPEFKERLANTGSGEPYMVSPEEFTARIKTDYEKYGKLIRSIGVKVE